jgi:sortase A
MKALVWMEKSLVLVGGLAGDIWIWSHAVPTLYESWQEREFDSAAQNQPSSPSPAPAPSAREYRGPVGRLLIPRLHLRAVVREGDGENTLSLALGHIPSTALPGQEGNVAVAGHRDTIFRGLRDIRKNDLIVFETRSGKYSYRVDGTEIVKPSNVNVLKASATNARELTLVTCYPFHYIGSAPDRFIVKARQVVATPGTGKPRRPIRSRKVWRAA